MEMQRRFRSAAARECIRARRKNPWLKNTAKTGGTVASCESEAGAANHEEQIYAVVGWLAALAWFARVLPDRKFTREAAAATRNAKGVAATRSLRN